MKNVKKSIIIKEEIKINNVLELTECSKNNLVVSDTSLLDLFRNKITDIVDKTNSQLYLIDGYSLKDALKLSELLLRNHIVNVIAIGGGTVNDVCKLATRYSNSKLISFPTIISNDGVCSNTSVLKIDDVRTDGFDSKSPDAILVDINVIKNSPSKYLKAGICDILSNYSAVFDWDLAISKGKEEPNDLARIMSSNAFWSLFNLPDNIEEELKIKIICESIIMSGLAMEIKGNTRPCSGSEHLFNHAIVAYHPEIKVLHGYLVGLGSLVSSILQKQNFNKLVGFLKRNDIDVRPSSLGISKEIFADAWLKAKDTRPNRYTILNEIEINKEMLLKIYDKIEREAY